MFSIIRFGRAGYSVHARKHILVVGSLRTNVLIEQPKSAPAKSVRAFTATVPRYKHHQPVVASKPAEESDLIDLDPCVQLYREGKYADVVVAWENVKKFTRKLTLGEGVLEALVLSAQQAGKHSLILGMVDFAKTNGVEIKDPIVYRYYMSACAENPSKNWTKAHSMVEHLAGELSTLLPTLELKSHFEEAVNICATCGKWRTALDIIGQMRKQPFGLTPPAIRAAMTVCCSQFDKTPVQAAFALFMYMHKHNIPRDLDLYLDIMRAMDYSQRFDEIHEVWRILLTEDFDFKKSATITDQLYAYRIDSFFRSNSPTSFEDAMLTFDAVCDVIVNPKMSARSLYKGLLGVQNFEEARAFVDRVNGMGKKMKFPRSLIAQHVNGLCELAEFVEAATFLLGLTNSSIGEYSDGSVSAATPVLWQAVLSGVIREHNPNLAVKVFNALCDLRSSKGPNATDAREHEQKSAEDVVRLETPYVIEMLGKDRRWQQALGIVTL
jgi:hypothetical protein